MSSASQTEGRSRKRSAQAEPTTVDARGSDLLGSVSSARASLTEGLQTQADNNPWRLVGLAVAAGYVAGGGLFSPLTARLLGLGLRLGLRLAVVPMVRQEIANLAGSVRQGAAS